jgi:hypothetical protein
VVTGVSRFGQVHAGVRHSSVQRRPAGFSRSSTPTPAPSCSRPGD